LNNSETGGRPGGGVLIVEDSQPDAALILEELRGGRFDPIPPDGKENAVRILLRNLFT